MSNGDRSQQRDMVQSDEQDQFQGEEEFPTKNSCIMPDGTEKRIRYVEVYYQAFLESCDHITGFAFFDKEGAFIWQIGETYEEHFKVEAVEIEENQVIVGVL